jgi:hypothetical protein
MTHHIFSRNSYYLTWCPFLRQELKGEGEAVIASAAIVQHPTTHSSCSNTGQRVLFQAAKSLSVDLVFASPFPYATRDVVHRGAPVLYLS